MRDSRRSRLFLFAHLEPVLEQDDARIDHRLFERPAPFAGISRRSLARRSPSLARRRRGCTSCGRRSRLRPRPGSAACSAARTSGSSRARSAPATRPRERSRGLTRSVIALIVPPLPAPSRPSNTMQTLRPFATTHSCSLTSSPWSRSSSSRYFFSFIFFFGPPPDASSSSCFMSVSPLVRGSPMYPQPFPD